MRAGGQDIQIPLSDLFFSVYTLDKTAISIQMFCSLRLLVFSPKAEVSSTRQ